MKLVASEELVQVCKENSLQACLRQYGKMFKALELYSVWYQCCILVLHILVLWCFWKSIRQVKIHHIERKLHCSRTSQKTSCPPPKKKALLHEIPLIPVKVTCFLSSPTEVLAIEDPAEFNSEFACELAALALIYTACCSAVTS